jgi:DNA primase
MVWVRETESGVFDTPERRAALEAKLREISRSIGDESVRRHYAQAFAERVAAFFPRANSEWRGANRTQGRERSFSTHYSPLATRSSATRNSPFATRSIPISDRLRRSTLLAGRATHPLREVVLVMTMVNHPTLLAAHLDEFAHIEFSHPDLDALRDAILDLVAHGEAGEAGDVSLRAPLTARFDGLLSRLEGQIEAAGHWPATPEAADQDANEGWLQALTLHRRKRTLHRELRDAEAALADDPSEANLARLVDIQQQLARSEGTEALIEGFGASSGRTARVF